MKYRWGIVRNVKSCPVWDNSIDELYLANAKVVDIIVDFNKNEENRKLFGE